MKIERDVIVGMLLPAFLPFNLIKGVLNTTLTLIIYKPLVTALRKTGSIEPGKNNSGSKIALVSEIVFLIISVVLLVIVLKK